MPDDDLFDGFEMLKPAERDVRRALATIDWTRILPCGHPAQRIRGLAQQPPCATCSPASAWYAQVERRHDGYAHWEPGPVTDGPPPCVLLRRRSIRLSVNGRPDLTAFWVEE